MSSKSEWRGDRRIRVGLEIDEYSARPVSMWVLEGPAVQRPSLEGSHVVRVDVSGRPELVQSFDNPRRVRAVARPGEVGHHFGMRDSATVYVDVPVRTGEPLSDVAISVTDLSQVADRPADPAAAMRLFDADRRPREMRSLSTITLEDLQAHPDWEAVSQELQGSRPAGD